ncbi:hypothetical protein GCT19_42315 [Paraburkholderia sp. CNPSo 3155]|nr:hypothetical protein [Paraburkholderia atlantica]
MPGLCNSNNTISAGNPQRFRLYGLFRLDYLNNVVEQHHRAIKRIIKPMMGPSRLLNLGPV